MPPREDSPYTTLGIASNSDEITIKRAYRKLALKWHPDKHTEAKDKLLAEKQFKKIAQAYEILSDAKKREEFDRSENTSTFRSRRGRKGDEFRSPFDIFREFFGDRDPFQKTSEQLTNFYELLLFFPVTFSWELRARG
ncbi:unnamed protein product [Angiostrongylus costaricensis]|uniref:J domain-containing protein n=1 Tax=Angiostrongylus costaricensis TaxID=334426 RepID=A0A0R3PX82_ANGCS|nr:unnamed protein product [Angiostrongylus costaricensis]